MIWTYTCIARYDEDIFFLRVIQYEKCTVTGLGVFGSFAYARLMYWSSFYVTWQPLTQFFIHYIKLNLCVYKSAITFQIF